MKKDEILTLLRERNSYVSGQELCEKYGVSRTAVWKVMSQLKKEGYEIESVQNKGYRLVSQEDVLSEAEIKSRLSTKWAGQQVVFYDITGSTNNDSKLMAEQGATEGTLVVADAQSSGKGRRGRVWETPKGTNIAMSLLLRPAFAPNVAPGVTLVMALAVSEAISKVTGLQTKIKWPNDIVANGKKICGILTEMSVEMDAINYVVIGVGINVNGVEFPEEIKTTATSLRLETDFVISRAELIAEVMKCYEEYYEIYCQYGNLKGLVETYNNQLVSMGKEVRVLDPLGEYNGISHGINEQGELLVEKEDGTTVTVYAGEVSVRGIYGYV